MAALPNGYDVLMLGSSLLRERLTINIIEELKAKATGPGVVEMGNQVAVCRKGTSGGVSTRHVSTSLSVVQ